uniref:CCHC-type domain-containing protein n=1 Tax=Populus alba TaxID=43335 RepID=A0A4V6A925_POPAL|nr:hypothetical protein D5086_0000135230 [Populus alba]
MSCRHIASECTTKSLCWSCREPGHMASTCPNEGICHTCGKAFHRAKECTAPPTPPGDLRLCNNCYKQGHIAADFTDDKACNNCRKTGHLARECLNEPICNMCNVVGHVELPPVWTYEQGLHGPLMICHNCGGEETGQLNAFLEGWWTTILRGSAIE